MGGGLEITAGRAWAKRREKRLFVDFQVSWGVLVVEPGGGGGSGVVDVHQGHVEGQIGSQGWGGGGKVHQLPPIIKANNSFSFGRTNFRTINAIKSPLLPHPWPPICPSTCPW